ncbi:hypothetical protein [Desulfobacter sp.]|uniref:hypothetical protein n=1 Tax=Desulfobacter sp. TaxID=2294 RepID=UPI003D108B3C
MKIILHATENHALRNQLKNRIEDTFPKGRIILTNSGRHLSEVLCRPLHNVSVLVAFISDSQSVSLLLPLTPLFENLKLILIFCKRIDEVQKSALLLEPLYSSYSENNFQDVISVLQRMEQKQKFPINRF